MNSLLADLNVDSKFIMVAGVFFTLTFLISTIIVIFITKIRSLKYIIEQAKEIDRAKIEKIND